MDLIQRDIAKERERRNPTQAPVAPVKRQFSDAVSAGIAAGNINFTPKGERLELSESSVVEQQKNEELLEEFDRRRMARTLVVPTDDGEVKAKLKECKQPICLFGEGPGDRRDRLREQLAILSGDIVDTKRTAVIADESKNENKEVWYHEGSQELLETRRWIAQYSLPRANDRLKEARKALAQADTTRTAKRQQLYIKLRTFVNHSSQVGDARPVSFCQFSPKGDMLSTGSWSGLCKIWSVPDCKLIKTLRGHNERVGAIVWHPGSGISQDPSGVNLASCAADGTVRLFSLESETPIASLTGHDARVARVAFHPSGRYLASTCFDRSWRLWDVERKTELLHQEGHSRDVYDVAFHPDGSLAATCGMDALIRIWDLRSGRNVMVLPGHMHEVLTVDFSPNGFHLASGGGDNAVKIWDLREDRCIYTLPAHTNVVSSLKYEKTAGDFIVTGSFDNSAKLWTAPTCASLRTLAGHESKVMCVDISPDNKFIVTASYDRTFKLWCSE